VATSFASSDQRAAVAAHAGATNIIWLIVRQGLWSAATGRRFQSGGVCEALTANDSAGDMKSGDESPQSKSKN